jgi:hypothetical protein
MHHLGEKQSFCPTHLRRCTLPAYPVISLHCVDDNPQHPRSRYNRSSTRSNRSSTLLRWLSLDRHDRLASKRQIPPPPIRVRKETPSRLLPLPPAFLSRLPDLALTHRPFLFSFFFHTSPSAPEPTTHATTSQMSRINKLSQRFWLSGVSLSLVSSIAALVQLRAEGRRLRLAVGAGEDQREKGRALLRCVSTQRWLLSFRPWLL